MSRKLTKPQARILAQACVGEGVAVWGRSMAAVENLEKFGLVTAQWRIEQGGQQSRWAGKACATNLGRKINSGDPEACGVMGLRT